MRVFVYTRRWRHDWVNKSGCGCSQDGADLPPGRLSGSRAYGSLDPDRMVQDGDAGGGGGAEGVTGAGVPCG
jgi:hypothetical protein